MPMQRPFYRLCPVPAFNIGRRLCGMICIVLIGLHDQGSLRITSAEQSDISGDAQSDARCQEPRDRPAVND
jgi:hypothetical protein